MIFGLGYWKDLGSAPAPSHGCFPGHSPSYPGKTTRNGPVSPGPVISSIPVTLVATITFTVGATSGLGLALGFAIPFTFSRGKVRWIPWLGRDISAWRRVSHNSNCTLETIAKDRIQVISNNSCVVPGELQLSVVKSKTAYTIFSRGNIADKILKEKIAPRQVKAIFGVNASHVNKGSHPLLRNKPIDGCSHCTAQRGTPFCSIQPPSYKGPPRSASAMHSASPQSLCTSSLGIGCPSSQQSKIGTKLFNYQPSLVCRRVTSFGFGFAILPSLARSKKF